MSVLMEFAIFPTDKGAGVSEYVSQVIDDIRKECPNYQLTAMGTLIETDSLESALQVVQRAYHILEPESERVYATIKLDIRKNTGHRLKGKIDSIRQKIGDVNS